MLLKSLEMQGFKSFPDKTKLTFDKGITAVVGPNGSGKSNISDAVRWVLGEQSTKTLRGSKMEDVVFGGTPVRKAMGFAEVSLTIDNRDRRLSYDSDEVTVTRRYYRSGDSDYMINRTGVRLKDVHELFMDTGLGRDGYSMIGQGKIADIVGSKSEDRREIFEEAAGISKYRYRKNEAERKLNQAEENLLRLRDILSELETRVGPLEEDARKAKIFLELSEEKRALEIGLWLNTLEKSKEALREQEYRYTLGKSQFDEAEQALSDIEAQSELLFQKSRRIETDIDQIRRDMADLEEQAAAAKSQAAVLENDIFHNEQNIERIREELSKGEQAKASLSGEIENREAEIQQKETEIAAAGNTIRQAQAELEQLNCRHDEFSGRFEALSKDCNRMSLELAQQQVEEGTCRSSLHEIQARQQQVQELTAIRAQSMQADNRERELLAGDLKRIEEEIDGSQNALKGYEFKLQSKKSRLEETQKTANRLLLDAGEKERRFKLLEDLERNLEGFAQSVKVVMKFVQRGMLKGVHGPVSRLIHVDAQYSTAIEIALGSAMQNIVVGTEGDAKQAIALLKQQNGGRATFLPLTSVKGSRLQERELADCPGFVSLACDLVKCDGQYASVVQSLLGRIAIVEDLDYAVSIAKRFSYRFRLVTLDGQVVNAGGSLTGGSLSRNAGLLGRAQEIEDIKKSAAALREKADRAQEDVRQGQQELAALEAEVLGLRGELATAQEDKIKCEAEIRRLDTSLAGTQEELARLQKEQEQGEARCGEMNARLAAAREEAASLQTQITRKQSEMDELTGGRQDLNEQRENLTRKIADGRLGVVALERDISALRTAIEETRGRQSQFEQGRQALLAQIGELERKNQEIRDSIEDLQRKTRELRQQGQSGEAQIAALQESRQAAETSVTQLRQQERELQNQREAIGRDLARLEERKASVQKDYDDIIKKLWDEYELTRSEAENIAAPIEDIPKGQRRLAEIKNKIKGLGHVNVGAIEEYAEVSERFQFMSAQVADVEKAKEELGRLIHDLTSQMREMFLERFTLINEHFGKIFGELFGGGTASLLLTNPQDVLSSGIEIKVQPPGKLILNLESLSGGEKALIAISMYFAIMKVSPPPFCFLDEIEAALDDVNVDRYAAYLRRMSDNTQFIVITHRRGTMEEADVLYGVTMQQEGVSKLLEMRVSEALKHLGQS